MGLGIPLRSALIALLLALPPLALAGGKCERLVATGTADNPPFLWRDPKNPQRLIGANAELLKQIGKSLEVKVELLYSGDAAKALDEVRSGRADILADARLVTERLDEMDFVHPSIAPLQTVAWVRNEPGFFYASREDLAGHNGSFVSTSRFGNSFDAFAKQKLTLQPVASLQQAVDLLVAGKSDYVLHERYSALAGIATLGLMDMVQRLEPPVLSQGMHLAISHNSACNDPWLRGHLARKMTELRAAGVPDQLLVSNLERWKSQQVGSAKAPQQ